MRYYWGIVLISLGIVVMVLDPFDKLDPYLRGAANTVLTATLLGLAALTTVVALWARPSLKALLICGSSRRDASHDGRFWLSADRAVTLPLWYAAHLDRWVGSHLKASAPMSGSGHEQTMSEPSGASALHPLSGHWS
jgi:hypothetical protein